MERDPENICSLIKVNEKWALDIGDETRAAIWDYMEIFCEQTMLYFKDSINIPKPVVAFCKKYAHLFEGASDLKGMDVDSLMQFAMTFQSKIPQEELETLVGELQDTDLEGLQEKLLNVVSQKL